MQICSRGHKEKWLCAAGREGGRRSHLLPSKLLWVTNRPLGNGWLLMGLKDCPSQSTIFEQTVIKRARRINIHSLTCSLQVIASGSRRVDLTGRQTPFSLPPPPGSETVESEERLQHLQHVVWQIYCVPFAILSLNCIEFISLSIVLCLSFIDCLLSPIYVAACMSKTIFSTRQ